MAITATIQHRKGNRADFDKNKMTPAEIAVALDTRQIFVAFAPGDTKELASSEDVENLIEEFKDTVKTETESAINEIKNEGEKILDSLPDNYEITAAKAEKAIREKAPAIIESATGTTIVATDSSSDPFRGLTLGGYTEQVKITGKNLLQNTAAAQTTNGVTFTVNEDGSVIANGTASNNVYLVLGKVTLAANTYILSGGSGSGSAFVFTTLDSVTKMDATGNGVELDISSDTELTVQIKINSGASVSNMIFYPMIRLASIEDATYEPYTGGAPSPSPEYPQELVGAGKWGNLLDTLSAPAESISTVNEDKSITITNPTLNQLSGASKVLTGMLLPGTYTFTSYSGTSKAYVMFNASDYAHAVSIGNSYTFYYDGASYLKIMYENILASATVTFKAQINYGTTAMPYRPYTGQKEIAVDVLGKNLLPYPYEYTGKHETMSGVTITDNGTGTLTLNGTSTNSGLTNYNLHYSGDNALTLPAGTYMVSSGIDSSLRNKLYIVVAIKYSSGTVYKHVSDVPAILTLTEDTKVAFTLQWIAGASFSSAIVRPMLELGTTATAYEPYKAPQRLIHAGSLPGIPLGPNIPDTIANSPEHMAGVWFREEDQQYYISDTVDYESGKYVQRCFVFNTADVEYVYAGTSQNPNGNIYRSVIPTECTFALWSTRKLSNSAATSILKNEFTIVVPSSFSGLSNLYFLSDKTTTGEVLEEIRAEASDVMYVAIKPIETDLPASELAAYKALHTNYPVTTIMNDCDVNMDVEYNADTKTWILNQINSVASSIVSNL